MYGVIRSAIHINRSINAQAVVPPRLDTGTGLHGQFTIDGQIIKGAVLRIQSQTGTRLENQTRPLRYLNSRISHIGLPRNESDLIAHRQCIPELIEYFTPKGLTLWSRSIQKALKIHFTVANFLNIRGAPPVSRRIDSGIRCTTRQHI